MRGVGLCENVGRTGRRVVANEVYGDAVVGLDSLSRAPDDPAMKAQGEQNPGKGEGHSHRMQFGQGGVDPH